MDLLLPLFQLLYFIAHFLVSLCFAVYESFNEVYRILYNIYMKSVGQKLTGSTLTSSYSVKLPTHVVLVLLPEQYTARDLPHLTRVISLLFDFGIRHVTAYDFAGKVHEQENELQNVLVKNFPGLVMKTANNNAEYDAAKMNLKRRTGTLKLSSASDDCMQKSLSSTQNVYLNTVSFDSGIRNLQATIASLVKSHENKYDEIDVDTFHQCINCQCGLGTEHVSGTRHCLPEKCSSSKSYKDRPCSPGPDPDLVIVIGDYISSNGFPSWFLRLSEFVSSRHINKIDTRELTRTLNKYAKIEQRYGR